MNIKELKDDKFILIITMDEYGNLNMDNVKKYLSDSKNLYLNKRLVVLRTEYISNLVYIRIRMI